MNNSDVLKLVGFDPSLRHWGVAVASWNTKTKELILDTISVIEPVLPKGKQVRQNSLDLESSMQLFNAALEAAYGANAVFIELPVGSQSSRASAAYGICLGVAGALNAVGLSLFEVTATEVKLAGFGNKNATKKQMIDWAVNKHPEAPWPVYKNKGVITITESKAEHMADALGAIYAGTASTPFKQLIAMMAK